MKLKHEKLGTGNGIPYDEKNQRAFIPKKVFRGGPIGQTGPIKCAPCTANGAKITLEFIKFGKLGILKKHTRTITDTEIIELCKKVRLLLKDRDFTALVQFRLMLSSREKFNVCQKEYFANLVRKAEDACSADREVDANRGIVSKK